MQNVEIHESVAECPACGGEIHAEAPGVLAVPVAPGDLGLVDSTKFWILIAVGVLVVLGGGIYVLMKIGQRNLEGVLEEGQKRRVQADLSTYKVALHIYRMNADTYPSTEQGLAALVTKPTTGRIPRGWVPALMEEMLDPWGQPYGYRYPPQMNRTEPDIYSSGPDLIEGTEDDVGNWHMNE